MHQLFIDFKKAYDSVRREVLYNILMEFGIPKKQGTTITYQNFIHEEIKFMRYDCSHGSEHYDFGLMGYGTTKSGRRI